MRNSLLKLICLIAFAMLLATIFAKHAKAEEWKPLDRQLFVAAAALSTIDWLQTRDIVRRSNEFHEKNPFLGKAPSMGEVNTQFLIRSAALTAVAFAFPEYRTPILGIYVAVTVVVIGRNATLGLLATF